MKKTLLFALLVISGLTIFAQQRDVTKFLGIPVDGTKSEMIQKLKAKGFRWNMEAELLEGEFNGRDVAISIVTNNNNVYRIVVIDAISSTETSIKIRFNTLCNQFTNNDKYMALSDYTIDEDEDISYGISVKNKRYEAAYYQVSNIEEIKNEIIRDTIEIFKYYAKNGVTRDEIANLSEEQNQTIIAGYIFEKIEKRKVWFMINEMYGEYRIVMYYDNGYNAPNGEDL